MPRRFLTGFGGRIGTGRKISSLYLRVRNVPPNGVVLPGGVLNRSFVKSTSRGISALQDSR